jgi:hypothetical protein
MLLYLLIRRPELSRKQSLLGHQLKNKIAVPRHERGPIRVVGDASKRYHRKREGHLKDFGRARKVHLCQIKGSESLRGILSMT